MDIVIRDTRSGEDRALRPGPGGSVGIYACGPTVYGPIHIGNARPFVVFSLFKRFLESQGLDVTLVINVTDVNDKIYDAARPAGRPSGELAREMTARYVADTDALGLGRPDAEPLATQTIGQIIALIETLIERGHAYVADGDVYFDVRSDPDYGSLSHRSVEAMDQGEASEDAARKRSPLDFALWKAHKPGEDTAWDAPWGRGRPAWHIECSAMGEQYLGLNFQIHGGGTDLVFPHHENEAAQTRAARGQELAQIWMHNGMLLMGQEKMAKSVGNIALLGEVVERWGRDAVILAFAAAHYRQPMAFDDSVMTQATRAVARIREAAQRAGDAAPLEGATERFFGALADDFNTPAALAVVYDWIRAANSGDGGNAGQLREMLAVLALDNLLEAESAPPEVISLARERMAARAARDYAESDRLRDAIAAAGWTVRDTADGFELVPA